MRFTFFKRKILISVSGIFLIVLLIFFQNEIKNFFYFIFSPIQKWLWQTGKSISIFFETISEIKNLKRENEELKLRIAHFLAENEKLKELKKENEILREALNLGLKEEFELKLTQIIGKDISQDFILIDKGFKDGLSEGFPVITQQKSLVGKITKAYKNFSKVQLITAKNFSFDVKISEKEIFGLAKGKGNFRISLELIPREKEIIIGDKVLTSTLGGKFPAGILVGEIKNIKRPDISPFQEAEIQPAFNIQKLDFLFVITNFI